MAPPGAVGNGSLAYGRPRSECATNPAPGATAAPPPIPRASTTRRLSIRSPHRPGRRSARGVQVLHRPSGTATPSRVGEIRDIRPVPGLVGGRGAGNCRSRTFRPPPGGRGSSPLWIGNFPARSLGPDPVRPHELGHRILRQQVCPPRDQARRGRRGLAVAGPSSPGETALSWTARASRRWRREPPTGPRLPGIVATGRGTSQHPGTATARATALGGSRMKGVPSRRLLGEEGPSLFFNMSRSMSSRLFSGAQAAQFLLGGGAVWPCPGEGPWSPASLQGPLSRRAGGCRRRRGFGRPSVKLRPLVGDELDRPRPCTRG